MGVVVMPIEIIPDLNPGTLQQLTVDDHESWSAATVCADDRYLVVMNTSHSQARQSSSLMHELAHIVIGHKPARLDITEDGLMILHSYDKTNEEEANWLAGALLLPREALFLIRRRRMSDHDAVEMYGCSQKMLSFRFQVTAVDLQIARAGKFAKRPR